MNKHWKTTTLGIMSIVSAVIGAATVLINTGDPSKIDYTTFISALLAGWGLIHAADASPAPDATPAAPKAAGFSALAVIVGIAVAVCAALYLLVDVARADDFGGCWKTKASTSICADPVVSVSAIRISLKDGKVLGTAEPNIGYGVTWYADKWYKLSASLNAGLRPTTDGEAFVPSIHFAFANYVFLGLDDQLGGSKKFRDTSSFLFGFGTSFGSTPASEAK